MILKFIGVGAEKCGTTWLSRRLEAHPEVDFIDTKDAGYFKKKDFRIHEYKKHFSHNDNKIKGDWSVQYFNSRYAAAQIKKNFPDTKIIVSLRDPVERMISAYNYHKYYSLLINADTFEDALQKYPKFLIGNSMYFDNLSFYLELFKGYRLKHVLFDDIVNDPKNTILDLYSYLQLKSKYLPKNLNKKENIPRRIKVKILDPNYYRKYYPKLSEHMVKIGFHKFAKITANIVRRFNIVEIQKERIDVDLKAKLKKMFIEDIEKTESLLDKDLSVWKA